MHTLLILAMLLPVVILPACVNRSPEILEKSIDTRTDVFFEPGLGEPESGLVDLVVKVGFKTSPEGFYALESKDSPYGKPTYLFLINIDGQHAVWQMAGKPENTSRYDDAGKWTTEGGPGVRYMLEKRIRLSPGKHSVFIALPGEHYSKEFDVSLREHATTILELTPVYWRDNRPPRQNYLHGIVDFVVSENTFTTAGS